MDPELFEMDDEVIKSLNAGMSDGMNIVDHGQMDEDGNGSDLEKEGEADEDILKALNMDKYDEDGDDDGLGRFLGGSLDNANDPDLENYDDDEDVENQRIRPTDSCILVGNTTEDESVMEVYLFDESTNNLYVHHDFNLPSFPLSVTWLNTNPKPTSEDDVTGSYAAVGTFLPGIEIWNCDVMNPIEPVCILGGLEAEVEAPAPILKKGKKVGKKTKKAAPKLKEGSHSDAVMCLAWHKAVPTRLASGSADMTVKLWDITTQQCTNTYTHHKDKVQSLEWNPTEHFVILSGSYDRTVHVMDVRAPAGGVSFKVSADIETAKWNPQQPYLFIAATEDGVVTCRDIRNPNSSEAVWTIQAHQKAASCVSLNSLVPTLFATGSVDETVKIWDTSRSTTPECIASRNLDVGKLFAMQFDQSSPFVLAAGGDGGALAIWDVMENIEVNARYANKAQELGLGDQSLPQEYIEMQKQGIQSKGLGPGREHGSIRKTEDDDSDDEDMRMDKYRGGDEEEEEEEDADMDE